MVHPTVKTRLRARIHYAPHDRRGLRKGILVALILPIFVGLTHRRLIHEGSSAHRNRLASPRLAKPDLRPKIHVSNLRGSQASQVRGAPSLAAVGMNDPLRMVQLY
jgi:hypothetical protein